MPKTDFSPAHLDFFNETEDYLAPDTALSLNGLSLAMVFVCAVAVLLAWALWSKSDLAQRTQLPPAAGTSAQDQRAVQQPAASGSAAVQSPVALRADSGRIGLQSPAGLHLTSMPADSR